MPNTYRDLNVWQRSMDLAELCYKITKDFPSEERFAAVPQIRRSAASIPANIAEGQGRVQPKEFLQFLRIARGSLAELETHLMLCGRVGLLSCGALEEAMAVAEEVSKMLRGLQKAIADKTSNS